MDRLSKKKFRLFEKVVMKLIKEWHIVGWRIILVHINDEENVAGASTEMNTAYKHVTFTFNSFYTETYEDIVEYARHEVIHLTQSPFIDYFHIVEETIRDGDQLMACSMVDNMARDAMEKAVVNVELMLNATSEYNLKDMCSRILKQDYETVITI